MTPEPNETSARDWLTDQDRKDIINLLNSVAIQGSVKQVAPLLARIQELQKKLSLLQIKHNKVEVVDIKQDNAQEKAKG